MDIELPPTAQPSVGIYVPIQRATSKTKLLLDAKHFHALIPIHPC